MGRDLKPVGMASSRTIRPGDSARSKSFGSKPFSSGGGSSTRSNPWNSKRYDTIHSHKTSETESDSAPFPRSVHPDVAAMLTLYGERTPYSHQAQAAKHFLDEGCNVALVTPTASGKTISFLAPVLTELVNDPEAVALMIYPMNALATDQLKNLVELGFKSVPSKAGIFMAELGGVQILAGVLNGDSSEGVRRAVRESVRLVITNHAALHASILQQARREYSDGSSWRRVLRNLKVLVLDEAHTYNGVQGTNAALAFRRLFAQTESLSGGVPRVILATATIGNPLEHAISLTGLKDDWAVVDRSGAKQHKRLYEVILPAEHPKGGRWAASVVAQELALEEVTLHRRVLIFCPSRAGTERMADKINEKLGRKLALAFNSSIPTAQKREFLAAILNGEVQVVCTTSALELGVDIGSMDTVIILAHPGDNASFNQRAGRVGRTRPGRVYLVLDENGHPLNTYLESNPDAIFWDPESRTVYPENKVIGVRHAACAMLETDYDEIVVRKWFPSVKDQAVADCLAIGMPHASVSMVGLGNFGQYKALDPNGRPLQELGGQDALLHWYPGAIIRSPIGEFFRVTKLDGDAYAALTEPASFRAGMRSSTSPKIMDTQVAVAGTEEAFDPTKLPITDITVATVADYDVTRQTIGYTEYNQGEVSPSDDPDATGDFHVLAPEQMNSAIGVYTRGFAFTLAAGTPLHAFSDKNEGATRAMADALGNAVSLMVQARTNDVPVTVRCDVSGLHFLVYDMAEGGMGWARALVGRLDRWLVAAGKTLKNCRCQAAGCPRCSLSPLHGFGRRSLAELMIAAGLSKKKPTT